MASWNEVTLMGNLTRNPEKRVAPSGATRVDFGIAVNERIRHEDGSVEERPMFIDVLAWGKLGETVATYLTKGRAVFIRGRLVFEQWKDKETGAQRSRHRVWAERVQFIGAAPSGASGGVSGAPGATPVNGEPVAPVDPESTPF